MLNLEELCRSDAALNPAYSQRLGRYLYRIERQGYGSAQTAYHWLKLQQQGVNHAYAQSFEHELQCYADLNRLEAAHALNILLPFSILQPQSTLIFPHIFIPRALCLNDAVAHFDATTINLHDQYLQQPVTHGLRQVQAKILHRLIQSVQVLANLHAVGYLHGDLKAEHFRHREGQCYLIDFEQAIVIERAQALAHAATPRYMAPELFHGKAKSVQSDIYALGIIWYEWLTQHRIQHKSYLDWAKWHCQAFNVALPAPFQAFTPLLERMLGKNQASRYAHIHEIKQALSYFA